MKAFYRCNPERATYLPLIREMREKNIPAIFIMIMTTGLKPEGDEPDEIIQMTAIKCYPCREDYPGGNTGDLVPADSLSFYFRPSKKVSEENLRRNNISPELLDSSPYIMEKAQELKAFFSKPAVFITHSVPFLRRFFDSLAINTGLCLVPYAYIDTSELARDVVKPGFTNGYGYRELFRFFNVTLLSGDTNIVNTYGLVMLCNELVAQFMANAPVCGLYKPKIVKMEYLDRKRNREQTDDLVKVTTPYGDIFYNAANMFWEDPDDGLLLGFFDMEDLQDRAFKLADAADGADFTRRMRHLVTATA